MGPFVPQGNTESAVHHLFADPRWRSSPGRAMMELEHQARSHLEHPSGARQDRADGGVEKTASRRAHVGNSKTFET